MAMVDSNSVDNGRSTSNSNCNSSKQKNKPFKGSTMTLQGEKRAGRGVASSELKEASEKQEWLYTNSDLSCVRKTVSIPAQLDGEQWRQCGLW